MKRLSFRFLCSFVVFGLLSIPGYGRMAQTTANQLRQSINDLRRKLTGALNANADPRFVRNLSQLLFNLNNIFNVANAANGQLDVPTIRAHLHHNLRQSGFTELAIPGQAVQVQHPAGRGDVPRRPFEVANGRSTEILLSSEIRCNPNFWMPLHASVTTVGAAVNRHLEKYRVDIYDNPYNPNGNLYLQSVGNHPISTDVAIAASFDRNFLSDVFLQNYIIPVILRGVLLVDRGQVQVKANIIRQLYHDQESFSGRITIRKLMPGEVIVRCCQKGSIEPGVWWVKIQDMPLSITAVRSDMAVFPNWNQNGHLEFFVVPNNSNIFVLEGVAASQEFPAGRNQYQMLANGDHVNVVVNPLNNDTSLAFPYYFNNPALANNINGQWLQGGISQIAIVGNWDAVNGRQGFAFLGCYEAIAIIETGFDVELL